MRIPNAHYFAFLALAISILLTESAVANEPIGDVRYESAMSDSGLQLDVYYFYFQPRCQTCIDIELFSKEAIDSAFQPELIQGTIKWHAYDVDIKEHEHFWYDFELETKSVVVVASKDGKQIRWKNCEKVWDLVLDKPAFVKYVQDEVRAFLNDK